MIPAVRSVTGEVQLRLKSRSSSIDIESSSEPIKARNAILLISKARSRQVINRRQATAAKSFRDASLQTYNAIQSVIYIVVTVILVIVHVSPSLCYHALTTCHGFVRPFMTHHVSLTVSLMPSLSALSRIHIPNCIVK